METKKFGKKIKLARVEMDMIQVELAKDTQIMQKNISLYETEQALLTLEKIEIKSLLDIFWTNNRLHSFEA